MSSGPYPAFWGTICDSCDESVTKGDNIYIVNHEKLCHSCADSGDYVCSCGNYKSSDYGVCYICNYNSKST